MPNVAKNAKPAKPAKPEVSMESARLLCATEAQAQKIAPAFGLELPDFDAIRETHERVLNQGWLTFDEALNEIATKIHFQRLAGTFVASAQAAGRLYSEAVAKARDLTSKLFSEDRDEDREGIWGFETRAERQRIFAAQLCIQSAALLAAAEGAVAAYKEITGEDWKPFQQPKSTNVAKASAKAQLEAFG